MCHFYLELVPCQSWNAVPTRIVPPNCTVHLNTVYRSVRNWTITSFKIHHSPYFRKSRCGEARVKPYCPFKQFSTVFFKGWNSWIQLLFDFLLAHRLKTLNKEQYDLTHVVLVVILQIFIKNTHGLACVTFSNVSSRLWLRDNTTWRILSIKEIYQVFIQVYNLLLLQRLLKIFSHGQYGLTHIVLSKKKYQTAFELCGTSQNFYPETIRFKSDTPLKYFIQVSTKSSILFSIFIKSCIFFSIYTVLNKFESGTIRVDASCPF